MEAEGAAEAWPGEEGKGSVEGLEKKLEALKVDTSSTKDAEDASANASEPTPTESSGEHLPSSETATIAPTPSTPPASLPTAVNTGPDPFAQYTYSEAPSPALSSARPCLSEGPISPTTNRGFRSYNGSTDEGVFGGADDADSLRGTYSRSVEVSEGGEDASDAMDAERAGVTSPPLPPLPTMGSPSVGTSPRSTEIGGSLGPTFIISVGDPQKIGSSLNVAAQHTVYTVRTRTTSKAFRKNDFSVLRRFSHFLWLFDALTLNNPGVIVPGMPEKNALGRFGADFVENRRSGLQAALMKIVSHPMLVGDPDLRLFLESDTFSIDIKQRKLDTAAESKGLFASLSGAITGPSFVEFDEASPQSTLHSLYFDTRRHILDTFETQLRSLLTSLSSASKVRHSLQASISELQSAFLGLAQCDLSPSLRKVLEDAARLQEKLRRLSEEQSASEEMIGGLNSVAEGYARLCASARLVFGARIKAYHVWQSAESALRKTKSAHEKAKKSGRTHSELLGLSVSEIAEAERKMLDAKQDFEDVSKLTKAEMARFDKEKVEDFKKAIEDYADGLATRQREVSWL
ncbi:Vps5 C terminal like-domain-containing protein [Leucosporidium creatinivorum]|uniref:Vps5 C terminal like-domain-containing protein n=1 Tax=Leucosporidium creatinivorum TaxID=106004 RepID=A0A1Y2G3F3_9BASI|nr:Vps5 C terminal like-domain-containing protein [Leucosporidium creatinivorum]